MPSFDHDLIKGKALVWLRSRAEEQDATILRHSFLWQLSLIVGWPGLIPVYFLINTHFLGFLILPVVGQFGIGLLLLWTDNLVRRIRRKTRIRPVDVLLPIALIAWLAAQYVWVLRWGTLVIG